MGIIIAKFRKKTSTFDVLTNLQNDIKSIEEFQKRTQETQRKIVFRFLILAVLIYATLAGLLYVYFPQISKDQRFLWSIPLITFPLVIWLIKKALTWYYNSKIRKNEKKLLTLKEKKKVMLENVMETETYKVAKQILDKFGDELKKPVVPSPQLQKTTPLLNRSSKPYESVLRQRTLTSQSNLRGRLSFGGTPERQVALLAPPTLRTLSVLQTPSGSATPALPRNILPRDRSVLDKMVDYLVGDGPSNRYALICHKCSSHNGMALKEEFEYMSYRCCYCGTFNPARKKRPSGPKFESPLMLTSASHAGRVESSTSEENSDSETETKPIVEEPRSDTPDTVKSSDFEQVSDSELLQSDESKMEVDTFDSRPSEPALSADTRKEVEAVNDN